MSKPNFQFKQFNIWHDKCAMKVNTDGILLGAWTKLNNPQSILDIGTGTGLIALMLAQRTAEYNTKIMAVDIDRDTANQALSNVNKSPFNSRIAVAHQDILHPDLNLPKFDVIVCNPPYFVDALKTPDEKRNLARHTDSLSFESLIEVSEKLASEDSTLNLILPVNEAELFLDLNKSSQWHLKSRCDVSHNASKLPFRSLLQFSRSKIKTQYDTLFLRNFDHSYSDAFTQLAKDFYLKM